MVELRHKEHIDPLIEYTSRARDCAVLGEGTWEVDSPYHRASQLGHLLHSRWKSQCYSGKGNKPLQNEEMTTNKGPPNEVSIEIMVRNTRVPTPKLDTTTREKGRKCGVCY
ncbi:hypothetical protein V6N13_082394 [Hibiscus sabdariffa]